MLTSLFHFLNLVAEVGPVIKPVLQLTLGEEMFQGTASGTCHDFAVPPDWGESWSMGVMIILRRCLDPADRRSGRRPFCLASRSSFSA